MIWMLGVLVVLAVLLLALTYAIWVVVCDIATQISRGREWETMGRAFAEHLKHEP